MLPVRAHVIKATTNWCRAADGLKTTLQELKALRAGVAPALQSELVGLMTSGGGDDIELDTVARAAVAGGQSWKSGC